MPTALQRIALLLSEIRSFFSHFLWFISFDRDSSPVKRKGKGKEVPAPPQSPIYPPWVLFDPFVVLLSCELWSTVSIASLPEEAVTPEYSDIDWPTTPPKFFASFLLVALFTVYIYSKSVKFEEGEDSVPLSNQEVDVPGDDDNAAEKDGQMTSADTVYVSLNEFGSQHVDNTFQFCRVRWGSCHAGDAQEHPGSWACSNLWRSPWLRVGFRRLKLIAMSC